MRPINSGPAKTVTIGLEFCSKMFQGLLQEIFRNLAA